METKIVKKAPYCQEEEHLIVSPPYCIFGTPHIDQSQSIIFKVGAMKEMLESLDNEDSFRIEWFAGNRATEYSFIKNSKNKK